jgi:hypothetical protein
MYLLMRTFWENCNICSHAVYYRSTPLRGRLLIAPVYATTVSRGSSLDAPGQRRSVATAIAPVSG